MAAMAMLAVAIPSISKSLWPRNEQAEEALLIKNYDWKRAMRAMCFQEGKPAYLDEANCMHVVSDRSNVLIFGDSHAAHLWYGLHNRYRDVNFLQATAPSCTAVNSYNRPTCAKFIEQTINYLSTHHLDAIIVSGKWSYGDIDKLGELFTRLHPYAAKLILIGPIPEYKLPLPEVAARAIYAGRPELIEFYLASQILPLDNMMSEKFMNTGVTYISAYRTMCSPKCVVQDVHGNLVQWDNDHLTEAGSLIFAERLSPTLFERSTPNLTAPPRSSF